LFQKSGSRNAFCAGADLKGWLDTQNQAKEEEYGLTTGVKLLPKKEVEAVEQGFRRGGFASISSRRFGKKPLIACVDGVTFGGGMEMIVSTKIVLKCTSMLR